MKAPDPTQARAVTFGGRPYVLRPLEAADADRLIAFFRSHTADTVRERYGYSVGAMSADRAAAMVGIDQTRDLALGLFEAAPGGDLLHAVGRYCLDPGGQSAEFALVVRETKRRLGIGSMLLRTLVETARRRGLTELWGQIASDNGAMLELARRLGFTLQLDDGGRSERASLRLAPAKGRSRRHGHAASPAR